MEITLNYVIYQTSQGYIYFDKEYFLEQKEVINKILEGNDYNLTVKRWGGNDVYFDVTENYADAIKIIVNDINNVNSVLNKLYKDVFTDKVEILADVLANLTLGGWTTSKENHTKYFYPIYKRAAGFKFYCPNEYLKEKYQLELDIFDLYKEFILRNIVPAYYHEIGWWDRKSLRDNKELMDYLSENWLSEDHSIAYLD